MRMQTTSQKARILHFHQSVVGWGVLITVTTLLLVSAICLLECVRRTFVYILPIKHMFEHEQHYSLKYFDFQLVNIYADRKEKN